MKNKLMFDYATQFESAIVQEIEETIFKENMEFQKSEIYRSMLVAEEYKRRLNQK